MTEDEIQARWEENRQAVQDAKALCLETFRLQTRIRARAAAQARRRNPIHPVLNAREVAQVEEATEQLVRSRVELAEAQARFKAGVEE